MAIAPCDIEFITLNRYDVQNMYLHLSKETEIKKKR